MRSARTTDWTGPFKRDDQHEAKGQHRTTLDAALFLVVNRLANDQPLEIHGRHHILCPIKPDLVLTNRKPSDNTRAWSGSDPIAR